MQGLANVLRQEFPDNRIRQLEPDTMLNDTVMDTALTILCSRRAFVVSSLLVPFGAGIDAPGIARLTAAFTNRDKRFVVLASTGQDTKHWLSFVYDLTDKTFRVFDSMVGHLSVERIQKHATAILNAAGLDPKPWSQVDSRNPGSQQTNATDCGVFAILNAFLHLYPPKNSTPTLDIPLCRLMLLHLLLPCAPHDEKPSHTAFLYETHQALASQIRQPDLAIRNATETTASWKAFVKEVEAMKQFIGIKLAGAQEIVDSLGDLDKEVEAQWSGLLASANKHETLRQHYAGLLDTHRRFSATTPVQDDRNSSLNAVVSSLQSAVTFADEHCKADQIHIADSVDLRKRIQAARSAITNLIIDDYRARLREIEHLKIALDVRREEYKAELIQQRLERQKVLDEQRRAEEERQKVEDAELESLVLGDGV
jgi:hypothetical protein